MGKDSRAIRQEIEETRERMGDTIEALGYKADVPSRFKDNVNEKVETVKGTISDVVDNVKSAVGGATDRVGNVKDRLGDRVSRAAGPLQDADVAGNARRAVGMAAENPLGLAIGALAAGFLVGLMVPATDMERERIGPLREKLVDSAQSAGGDLMEHGKAVLQETAQAAMYSAQTHGGQVAEAAKTRMSGASAGAYTPDPSI